MSEAQIHKMPESYKKLETIDFYPDLLAALSGFARFMHEKKMCVLGQQIVGEVAEGFLRSREFNAEAYPLDQIDQFYSLKRSYLGALAEIHRKFSDRLPLQFYQVLAFMGMRPNPTVEEKIPDIEHLLPDGMKWKQADGILHSWPLCTRLYMDVQTTIWNHTGFIITHGCGCSCALPEPEKKIVVQAAMGDKPTILIEETESFLLHLVSQRFLLEFGLPQGIGQSVRSRMVSLRQSETKGSVSSALGQSQLRNSVHEVVS